MDAVRSCRGTMLREGDNLEEMLSSPPFPCEFFDRVLLDAPCSGVGQRPQLYNTMKSKEFLSFPKLQKKLLATVFSINKLYASSNLIFDTLGLRTAKRRRQNRVQHMLL